MQPPPILHGIHGQVGRIARGGHAHMPFVSFGIIDAIGGGPALGILGKIVGVHRFRLLSPTLTGVLKAADEFLLLRIDADARSPRLPKFLAFLGDVAKLSVTVRVGTTRVQRFAMAAQTELLRAEQPTNRRRTGPALQFPRQAPQPRTNPFLAATRISGGFRRYEPGEILG